MIESVEQLARMIDHTLLDPLASQRRLDALCDEAVRYGFAAVCVHPVHVGRAVARLLDSAQQETGFEGPRVASVVGFPLGATRTEIKVAEARRLLEAGAAEIDMVAPLWAIADGDERAVTMDLEAVVQEVHKSGDPCIVKVIIESAALSPEQIALACRCCVAAGADFVKTSTGFHPAGGASAEHVALLRRLAAPLQVKASGGIKTAEQALRMIEAGATRLGASASVAIVDGWRQTSA